MHISTSDEIKIRSLNEQDFVHQAQIFAWIETRLDRLKGYFLEQQRGERHIYLAVDGDQAVGYATLHFVSEDKKFSSRNIPEIVDVIVIERYQNRGIATRLIQACENHAREQGWKIIGIGVELQPQYEAAQHLYLKLGYTFIEGIELPDEWALYKTLI